jgi:hypothetical protein
MHLYTPVNPTTQPPSAFETQRGWGNMSDWCLPHSYHKASVRRVQDFPKILGIFSWPHGDLADTYLPCLYRSVTKFIQSDTKYKV